MPLLAQTRQEGTALPAQRARMRFDPMVEQILQRAVAIAGAPEQLNVDHLSSSLLMCDGGFVVRKLRHTRINVVRLVRELRAETERSGAPDPVGVAAVFALLEEIASEAGSISSQQLFVAILLEDRNGLVRLLRRAGVDPRRVICQRFFFLPRAHAFVEGGRTAEELRRAAGVARAEVVRIFRAPPPVPRVPAPAPRPRPMLAPTPPPRRSGQDRRTAERTARQWLAQLIPDQAGRYAQRGFIDVQSSLSPHRFYRIKRGWMTDVYECGRKIGESCLVLRSHRLPPTDRVIGEYFMIRGDEGQYLKTAIFYRKR